jgi:hypothetical protein
MYILHIALGEEFQSPYNVINSDGTSATNSQLAPPLLKLCVEYTSGFLPISLIICFKYVGGIHGCTTQAFPGATIGRLSELVSSGRINL